jgi:hypothetical protein
VGGVVGGVVAVAAVGALVVLLTRKRRTGVPAAGPTGSKRGGAMYSSNPEFQAGDVEAAVPQASAPRQKTAYTNNMFDDAALESPREGGAAAAGANQLYETTQSQLSDPGAARGGYSPSEASVAQSARSRLDSARSGLRSNPAFAGAPGAGILDSSDEEFGEPGRNPMFQSAQTDLLATADSDLGQLDTARSQYESAPSTARGTASALNTSRTTQSNAMYDAAAEPAEAANPLFVAGRKK